MKKIKVFERLLLLVMIIILSVLLVSCSESETDSTGNENSNTEVKTIKIASSVARNEDHPYTVATETFGNAIEEKTNGAIKATYYPGGQLGGDRDIFESIQMGNIDACVLSSPVIAGFTNVFSGVDMPYLFNSDYDLLYEALEGEPGQYLLKRLEEETNVKALSFFYQPFRHFLTKKEINSIDDLKGLKIRSMESPIHMEIFKSIGLNPTSLPLNDIYTSMQTGAIDGLELDIIGVDTMKFYEVIDCITISGHFNNTPILLVSEKLWDSLSQENKKVFEEAAKEAAVATFEKTLEVESKYMNQMKERGIKVKEIDIKEFQDLTKPVIEKYSNQIPEVKRFVEEVEALK